MLRLMSDYRKLKVWEKAHAMVLDAIKVALTIRSASRESDYHCLVARDLGLINAQDYQRLALKLEEIRKCSRA